MKESIAKDLLKIKAIFFRPNEPFIWASGIKSPVYCDNRLALAYPDVRNNIENGLVKLINENYPNAQALMGTSTAGIAHAAIAAHILNVPMGYVRAGSKDHGRKNQIEGKVEKGEKIVVVEDLISTGGSATEVVNVLRKTEADVMGIVSIFTYNMRKSIENFLSASIKNISLTDFDCVAQVAFDEGYINKEDIQKLIFFRDNPSDESWIGGQNEKFN
jgi:orotate phosphoribosyltransferase